VRVSICSNYEDAPAHHPHCHSGVLRWRADQLQLHGGGDDTKQFVRYRNIQVNELKGGDRRNVGEPERR
jgi:hypothetical protein